MASSLKSGPKTYLKVVKDSLRNEAEIKQGNDVEFVKQMEERGFDMENFVFAGYEDVAEPNTDPDHLNGNSEENVNTNPMSKMPTNSKNVDKKKRNRLNKGKKKAALKALAEVEAKKIVDESAESLEKAAAKALTEAIKALVKSEESLLNSSWASTSRVQAKTHTCPLGSEATHITDWSSFSSAIWTCKHNEWKNVALTWKSLYSLVFNGEVFVFGSVEVPKITTEDMPQSQFPIVCGDWDVRDMRKMVADLVQDDDEEINDNLGDKFKKMLEVDDFNQEDCEFYEEVSDDTGIGESSKDNEVHSEGSSDGSFCVVKRLLRRKGYQVRNGH